MFDRANAAVGAGWSLHALRHTAGRRSDAVSLGIPAYRDIVAATLPAPGDRRDR